MAFKEAFATIVTSPPVESPEPLPPSEDVPLEDGTDVVDDERSWTSSPAFSEEPLPDVFGLEHDPNIEARIPLVDLWSDLENHISADTITDPREFEEEVRQVQSIVDEAIGRLYEAGKPIPDPRHFAQNAQLHAVPPSDTAPGQVGGTKSIATAVVGGDTNKPRPNPKMSDFLSSLLRSLGQRLFGRIQ
ncbi:hypothetical protein DICSQDRAFT_147696 [Dichomitus squalens LYAD-421 SS1]|uniref:Uncharacterized protein n=1 Tax=Dichomitus squalens (strain LYAD-421) TaxID=732165 RepID=R7SX33_DICSQ|nr:uncharacterized protein DICSQDRAFT_147696 [Dichomitus squalens LYAD-421 SS1]EJF60709.1 hypothetical protein DICSQDRAFT_147696 [Dichomitus squalens LYAD-421 SS1]